MNWAIEFTCRGIGLVYMIAYIPFLWQYKGLWGKEGIRPIAEFVSLRRKFIPSLFWFNASDSMMLAMIWMGIFLGALLLFGVFPPLILLLLYIIHLSWVTVGQEFLGFGWETYLMEIYDLISLLALAYLILQLLNLIQTFVYNRWIEKIHIALYPYHLAYRHAIFSVMTTERREVLIEGSLDGVEWREYIFKYKPGPLRRRPTQISPFQPRLDWQAWFLPFAPFSTQPWCQRLFYCLLQARPEVLKLFATDPFSGQKPLFVRAPIYLYEYTTPAEKKQTGAWWKRTKIGTFAHPMKLN